MPVSRARHGRRGYDLEAVARRLVELAYGRVDMVSRRGEFAVRGGILDVFPPVADHPFRVEFFGDEVDQIRAFSVADQRSLPGEVRGDPPAEPRAAADARRPRARGGLESRFPGLRTMLEKMSAGIPVEGMESLLPAVADGMVPLVDYLPGAAVALVDPERAVTRAMTLGETNREFLEAAWSAATAAPTPRRPRRRRLPDPPRAARGAAERGGVWWSFSGFDSGEADAAAEGFSTRHPAAPTSSGCTPLRAVVPGQRRRRDGARRRSRRERVERRRRGLRRGPRRSRARRARRARHRRARGRGLDAPPEPGVALAVVGRLESGFELAEAKLAVLTEAEFYGRTIGADGRVVKKLASRRRNVVDPLQLKAGDIVVHSTHGIGRSSSSCSARSPPAGATPSRRRASTSCSSTRPPSAGIRATSSSCRPTSSTC
jgi:transcription-repair coupling factor (superfamily II helicase)